MNIWELTLCRQPIKDKHYFWSFSSLFYLRHSPNADNGTLCLNTWTCPGSQLSNSLAWHRGPFLPGTIPVSQLSFPPHRCRPCSEIKGSRARWEESVPSGPLWTEWVLEKSLSPLTDKAIQEDWQYETIWNCPFWLASLPTCFLVPICIWSLHPTPIHPATHASSKCFCLLRGIFLLVLNSVMKYLDRLKMVNLSLVSAS